MNSSLEVVGKEFKKAKDGRVRSVSHEKERERESARKGKGKGTHDGRTNGRTDTPFSPFRENCEKELISRWNEQADGGKNSKHKPFVRSYNHPKEKRT